MRGVLVARQSPSINARLDLLAQQIPALQRIREDQDALAAGKVSARDSRRRLSVANRINEACQRLELELIDGGARHLWTGEVAAIRALAESVLRENPVLQARGALSVIRGNDIPSRHVLNRAGRRERRKGFGLHRHVRNEEGPSVVVAFTPRGYEQMWHAHTVDEHTLALDVRFAGRYAGGKIHTLYARDGQLFHFHPHTYHTLSNQGTRVGRTFTLKYPIGISVWLPALELTGEERGAAEVWSAPLTPARSAGRVRQFRVLDAYHRYTVNVMQLASGATFDLRCDDPTYVYALDGRVDVRWGPQAATASANDLIVVEGGGTLRLRALTDPARVYWASDVAGGHVPPALP